MKQKRKGVKRKGSKNEIIKKYKVRKYARKDGKYSERKSEINEGKKVARAIGKRKQN